MLAACSTSNRTTVASRFIPLPASHRCPERASSASTSTRVPTPVAAGSGAMTMTCATVGVIVGAVVVQTVVVAAPVIVALAAVSP
jgi:hypothetical protein